MSVPLSATGRITLPYTISGNLHKFRVYCRNPQVAGATYNINSRPVDANDMDWHDAVHDLAEAFSWLMPTGWTLGSPFLEHQTGGIWTVLDTFVPTYTNHYSSDPALGWQFTLVFRDVLLKKLKWTAIEGNAAALVHYPAYSAIVETRYQNFSKEFMSTHTLTNAPYTWVVSRGNQYINTAPFVGLTVTTNKRARRRRGLT